MKLANPKSGHSRGLSAGLHSAQTLRRKKRCPGPVSEAPMSQMWKHCWEQIQGTRLDQSSKTSTEVRDPCQCLTRAYKGNLLKR